MSKQQLGLRIGLAVAAGLLAAGCAGVAVPTGGGFIAVGDLPALPEINVEALFHAAPQMQGHAADAIFHPYLYFSPNPLCER
jgi:hypothetical protein